MALVQGALDTPAPAAPGPWPATRRRRSRSAATRRPTPAPHPPAHQPATEGQPTSPGRHGRERGRAATVPEPRDGARRPRLHHGGRTVTGHRERSGLKSGSSRRCHARNAPIVRTAMVSDPAPVAASGADVLRGLCGGAVHLPGDASFDEVRVPWNLQVDARPAAVAYPAFPSEVADVVRAAASVGLKVAPAGHGPRCAAARRPARGRRAAAHLGDDRAAASTPSDVPPGSAPACGGETSSTGRAASASPPGTPPPRAWAWSAPRSAVG